MVQRLLVLGAKEIRILSRDEKKQSYMRSEFTSDCIKYFIGDIRDKQSLFDGFLNVDYVFHAAALKQVDTMENFPIEAVKTNLLGTENVIQCAIEQGVKKVVFLSTDKAVKPINAMGMSKALMEKLVISKLPHSHSTQLVVTRFGNVIASRGSVIPIFIEKIRQGSKIDITDLEMTRFIMSLDDAIDLVLNAFNQGKHGDFFVKQAPGAKLSDILNSISDILVKPSVIEFVGKREGEKIHEELLSEEELKRASIKDDVYVVNYLHKEIRNEASVSSFTSDTFLFNKAELKKLLLDNEEIQQLIK